MPNWCMNELTIYHEESSVIDELIKNLENMKEFTFLKTLDKSYDLREAQEVDWWRIDDNNIQACFDTAWNPPISVYESLEEAGFEVYASFYEPGLDFAGFFKEGRELTYELSEYDDDWFRTDPTGIELNESWDILSNRSEEEEWDFDGEDES